MKPFSEWLKEQGIEMPKGTINGAWFAEYGLPMIVRYTCCETTMVLPNAYIADEGYTYCTNCKGDD